MTVALVFLWFGVQQLTDPGTWVYYLPEFMNSLPIAPETIVILNGGFEVLCSLLLFLGLFVRIVSFVLGIHLMGIAWVMGFNATAVRDYGLGLAAIALSLAGNDQWCLGNFWKKKG